VTERFQELFMETRKDSIDWGGLRICSVVRRELVPGTSIDVEFLKAHSEPPQGLELAVKIGTLAWDEHDAEGSAVRLWADKQQKTTIRYMNPRKSAQLSVWNIWLDTSGKDEIVQAWWAWSGMRVDEDEDTLLLRCSGNYKQANFRDLVARLTFRSSA
jgi:hypothetical protein